MNISRLDRLIRILEEVERQDLGFNMAAWIDNEQRSMFGDFHDLPQSRVGSVEETCGTACCAFGYASLDHDFQKQGLQMTLVERDTGRRIPVQSIDEFNRRIFSGEFVRAELRYKGRTDFGAAAEFFGLDRAEADYLFDPGSYESDHEDDPLPKITPREVIERIEEVLSGQPIEE